MPRRCPHRSHKLEQRFGLSRVIVVTDRGIGTKENVTLLSETAEFAFITALKAPQVKKLVKDGFLQLSMFDELNLAEIACEQLYPGQRLVVCRNPLVAEDRARTRRELLAGTERDLAEIERRVQAGTLQGQADIGLAVGAVWNRYKVKKHFQVNITDDTFTYERKHEQIAQEAELDGIYVIRAGRIDPAELAAAGIVRAYKQLKEAEKGFGGDQGPARGPPDPPPPRGPRPRTPADLHARRVRALAPTSRVGRAALPRRQPSLQRRPGRQGHPLARRRPARPAAAAPPSRSPATRSTASSTSSRTAPATRSASTAARRPSRS